ncbi:DUF2922 domain-containing protein [Sporosarcina sp. G11-34]|uniref:DUF2922 domain-containing protein n=1 Tax=Sporosarcina sp. G11-34 TaxID=2849605 RepID=UPI0022A97456|nr:DUF2922 domain-containing protein [Sporosarcina sp. G11-34]MCZ2258169.1 DUF2922 domain-containing protein [Sporosarcina sp. G11-34]
MAKTLQLNFSTMAGKKMMLTVDEPRENLTAQEAADAMQEIINAGIFEIEGQKLDAALNASIVERNVTELIEG